LSSPITFFFLSLSLTHPLIITITPWDLRYLHLSLTILPFFSSHTHITMLCIIFDLKFMFFWFSIVIIDLGWPQILVILMGFSCFAFSFYDLFLSVTYPPWSFDSYVSFFFVISLRYAFVMICILFLLTKLWSIVILFF
jgi:hypothetical protein